jgi:hypothetical protein
MKAPCLVNARWFSYCLAMHTERTRDRMLMLSRFICWKKREECVVVSGRVGTQGELL